MPASSKAPNNINATNAKRTSLKRLFGRGLSPAGSGCGSCSTSPCSLFSSSSVLIAVAFLAPVQAFERALLFLQQFGILRRQRCWFTALQNAVHHGDKEQRAEGGDDQTANHRPAERCVLLSAIAKTEGHRHHADDHRSGGHDHRAQPHVARLERRFCCILP